MKALRRPSAALRRNLWFALNRRAFAEPSARTPRLFVDVSVIARHDARTGIQRVVRAIWSELKRRHHSLYDVVPVYAGASHGYRFARWDCLDERPVLTKQTVAACKGDIFLGLDLSAHYLPHCEEQLAAWRNAGAELNFVVYDLLPLQAPQWFLPTSASHFAKWFDIVTRHATGVVCISDVVAKQVRERPEAAGLMIRRMFLSGELSQSRPSAGVSDEARSVMRKMASSPAALMVGTLEPRKGHVEVLEAFEQLWRRSPQHAPKLVIAGKRGWKIEALQSRILSHPRFGKQLFWLQAATDEALQSLSSHAQLVIAASHGEGFGLPLVEAAHQRRWVLARDLPVFREQQLGNVRFFLDDTPHRLADSIEAALAAAASSVAPEQKLRSWSDCVDLLLVELGIDPAGGAIDRTEVAAVR